MTIILTLLLLLPSSVLAALVPCDGVEKLCSACKLVELAQNILNFVVGFTVLMSGVIFAIAGFKMVTSAGNSGAISQAKEMFTNVVVGLVILFSAWLIVDTVLKVLLPTNNGVAVISGYGPWHQIQCVAQPVPTMTEKSGGVVVSPSGSGSGSQINVRDKNGQLVNINLDTTQNDESLKKTYDSVNSKYDTQIKSACESSSIPNCQKVVTALIASESGGNPSAQSQSGSIGLLQLTQANGGQTCTQSDSTCIQTQIDKGVKLLNKTYDSSAVNGNLPNALAGYNGGFSTVDGTSPSGMRPPLALSTDCPGLLAYQCATNPGGLQETRSYVANICRTLSLNGSGCQ